MPRKGVITGMTINREVWETSSPTLDDVTSHMMLLPNEIEIRAKI